MLIRLEKGNFVIKLSIDYNLEHDGLPKEWQALNLFGMFFNLMFNLLYKSH